MGDLDEFFNGFESLGCSGSTRCDTTVALLQSAGKSRVYRSFSSIPMDFHLFSYEQVGISQVVAASILDYAGPMSFLAYQILPRMMGRNQLPKEQDLDYF